MKLPSRIDLLSYFGKKKKKMVIWFVPAITNYVSSDLEICHSYCRSPWLSASYKQWLEDYRKILKVTAPKSKGNFLPSY